MGQWRNYTSYSLHFNGADMTNDDTEFLLAIAAYQKRSGRRYPTWLEVLNVLRCLGYRKVAEPRPVSAPQPGRRGDRAAEQAAAATSPERKSTGTTPSD
jgi:hypothetical protein